MLGPLRVSSGREVIELKSPTHRTIVAMLASHAPAVVSSDQLIDAIWSDQLPAKPTTALQIQMSRLRKLLPDDVIVTTDVGYRMQIAPASVDLLRFRDLVERAGDTADCGNGDRERAMLFVFEALALWKGQPFVDVPEAEWSNAIVAELAQSRIRALETHLRWRLDQAELDDDLVVDLERVGREYPHHEGIVELAMLALYRAGRQADALKAFDDFRRRLSDELGLRPSSHLYDIELAIITHDPGLVPTTSPVGLAGAAPPAALTSFVGRSDDVARVRDACAEHRLVTVLGPGGVGKSRLVGEVFPFLDGHAQRAWFVALADLAHGALVASRVGSVLGVDVTGGVDPIDAIARQLRNWSCVLVLDNCENVLDSTAALAHRLLSECPGVAVLATSREALMIAGERTIRLHGLPIEDAETLLTSRAELTGHDVPVRPTMTTLCELVEGWPLAIELVAANLARVPLDAAVSELAAMINDVDSPYRFVPERHVSLAATLDWSYGLLSPLLQRSYCALGMFDGPIDAPAARAVLEVLSDDSTADDGSDATAIVEALVGRSLLEQASDEPGPEGEAVRMLRPVIQHAREQLAARPDDASAASAAFVDHFLQYSIEADARLAGETATEAVAEFALHEDNMTRAIDLALERADLEVGAALGKHMSYYWLVNSLQPVGVVWIERLLDLPADALGWERRADLLQAAGFLHGSMGSYAKSGLFLHECFELQERHHDASVVATINNLGNVLEQELRLDEAIVLLDRADELMDRYRAVATEERVIAAQWGLAVKRSSILTGLGDHSGALHAAERGMAAAELSGSGHHSVLALLSLAVSAIGMGSPDEAAEHLSRADDLALSLGGFAHGVVRQLQARISLHRGDLDDASRKIGESFVLGQDHELQDVSNGLVWRAEIERRCGEADRSAVTLARAIRISIEGHIGEHVVAMLHLCSVLLRARGADEDAGAAARTALALTASTGQCPPVGLELGDPADAPPANDEDGSLPYGDAAHRALRLLSADTA